MLFMTITDLNCLTSALHPQTTHPSNRSSTEYERRGTKYDYILTRAYYTADRLALQGTE